MRLVDDDGEAFSRRVDRHTQALLLKVRERLRDEGEFLDRGDDDGRALGQRPGQLPGVLVDLLDHAGLVLELVDGRLQLLIEHTPVGYDDDGVKHFLVALVVQAGQSVGQPRDGVRLAGTGRVLNQVVATRACGPGVRDELANGVELVVARKDHRLLPHGAGALVGPDLPFLHFEVHEALQDFQEAVCLQHLVPQVGGFPVPGHRRVARPVVVAAVEGQELGLAALQLGRHPCLVRVHREVDKCPLLKSEEKVPPVPFVLVLARRIGGRAGRSAGSSARR